MTAEGPAEASVIVVTARNASRLARSLDTLRAATADVPFELIVVLNAADDDVVRLVRERDDVDVFVETRVNLGFAGASNLGRKHATGEFLALVHDDTFPQPGWLSRLLSTARSRPEVGVIGPLVLRSDGKVNHAGPVLFADGASYAEGKGSEPAAFLDAEPRATDYCAGNSVMVRAAAWDAFGGLEESLFPAGYVDVDLAFSARRAGWEVLFEPRAAVFHDGGGSLSAGFRDWVFRRNRTIFTERWVEELRDYEPFDQTDPEGSAERAIARAARRTGTTGPPRREHRARPTELELFREYVSEMDAWAAVIHREWPLRIAEEESLRSALADARSALQEAGREVERTAAVIAERDAHLERLDAALQAEHRSLERLDAECRQLHEREQQLEAAHTRLRAREDMLEAILAGRWWKLRGWLRRLAGRR